ncbi:tyrosine-type recombinase/integrase [Methylocystis sp. MJC1]|uniref:tyrosine-type recombinase/integrase n=2 Tax=Methylocystis sp. MJC1 TaxID=2654282 RepID=UPI0013E9BE8B|nr:tyrosine-type recombinase/integrase [Methylocystis sp. MJC1]KAF2990826.1 Tyrosine recombinase XerD [Methylocystis sp. MJC1]MBU6527720.1 tyrosine-type recombinase/integrase [Methylocystis sp. MJC1]UZX10656.1 tyrosine-type recombinase/integrase [Methylocystis sp. MJC1]
MPRRRPIYLHKETTRHGRTVYYFRRDKDAPRIRINGEYGSEQFMAEYMAALAGEPVESAPAKTAQGTLAWLIERYRDSAEWAKFSPATKRQRENILKQVIKNGGDSTLTSIKRSTIAKARDKRANTPAQANHFLKVMRSLFKWAHEAGLVADNPTLGVSFARSKTDGHHVWTEEEVQQFKRRWPVGTRERLALAILLYTGLRRGDAARLGRQHVRDGVIMLNTEKTGTRVEIPILPELAEIIDASPTGDLAFIAKLDRAPMDKNSFGNWFRDACVAAGVPGRAHGLRKAGATRAAENGATEKELEAIFGWTDGGRTAAIYTREADRKKLARAAVGKLSRRKSNTRTTLSGAGNFREK